MDKKEVELRRVKVEENLKSIIGEIKEYKVMAKNVKRMLEVLEKQKDYYKNILRKEIEKK